MKLELVLMVFEGLNWPNNSISAICFIYQKFIFNFFILIA